MNMRTVRLRSILLLTATLLVTMLTATSPVSAGSTPASPTSRGAFDAYIRVVKTSTKGFHKLQVMAPGSGEPNWQLADLDKGLVSARFTTVVPSSSNGRPKKGSLLRVSGEVLAETTCPSGGIIGRSCKTTTFLSINKVDPAVGSCRKSDDTLFVTGKGGLFPTDASARVMLCALPGKVLALANAVYGFAAPPSIYVDSLTRNVRGKKPVYIALRNSTSAPLDAALSASVAVPVQKGTCTVKVGLYGDVRDDGRDALRSKRASSLTFPC